MGRKETWDQLYRSYLAHTLHRGFSASTRHTQGGNLGRFISFLREHGCQAPGDLRKDHLLNWQTAIGTLGPGTRHNYVAVVDGFLKWLEPDYPRTRGLREVLVRPRTPERIPKPIPAGDLERLMAFFRAKRGGLRHLRNRALWWVLLSSGARISEVLGLRRDSFQRGEARIRGKGGYVRILVLHHQAQEALRDYLMVREDLLPHLFIGTRNAVPLTSVAADKIWIAVAREVGVGHFSSHQLRHSCATVLWQSTHDLLLVADHLGHRNLENTRGYVKLDTDARRRALDALEPKPEQSRFDWETG